VSNVGLEADGGTEAGTETVCVSGGEGTGATSSAAAFRARTKVTMLMRRDRRDSTANYGRRPHTPPNGLTASSPGVKGGPCDDWLSHT